MSQTVFCESCGGAIAVQAQFCEHCGAVQAGSTPGDTAQGAAVHGGPEHGAAAVPAASAPGGPAYGGAAPGVAPHGGPAPGAAAQGGFAPGSAPHGGPGQSGTAQGGFASGSAPHGGPAPGAAAQGGFAQGPGPGRPGGFTAQQAAERIETLTPGATELAGQLVEQVKTPAVATALAAGAMAAAAVFAVGVLCGLIFSDQSLVGAVDSGKGVITAGLAQMLNFLQVGYSDNVGKLGPALFLVFPIGACAVAAATQAGRTRSLTPTVRLASGAGVGLVFGLLMLIPALASGSLGASAGAEAGPGVEPDVLGAVLLGFLWGSLGGLLGTYYAIRRELAPGWLAEQVPAPAADVGRTILAALRPLGVALAVMTVAGTLTWTVETLLKSDLREERSTLVATVDSALYGVEHGLHWTELGGLVEFHSLDGSSLSLPVPVGDATKVKLNSQGDYRLFGFNSAMPAYTFIPLLIFLIGVLLLLALYAGFAVARVRRATIAWQAGLWGCLVGPIWALALVIVNALIAKDFYGRAVGDSLFGSFLLGGLIVGGVGGLLSARSLRNRFAVAGAPVGAEHADVPLSGPQ